MFDFEVDEAATKSASSAPDRKRVEQALLKSEQKYRDLVENFNDILFTVDRKGILTYVSPVVEAIAGYHPSELIGKSFLDFIHPEDTAIADEGHRSALEGTGEPNEYRVRTKSGHYQWFRSHSRQATSEGEVVGIQGVLCDVTERRRAENALREAESRYRSMFENAVFGICIATPDGRFLDVNRAFVVMLGYETAEELKAADIADALYVLPEERGRVVERMSQQDRFGGIDVQLKRKGGDVVAVRLSGRTLRNETGVIDGFEIIAEDITERHALEEQYRQAQKMEAIGRLAGGVAHDFNNLLTVINGHAELLLASLDSTEASFRDVSEIRKAGERAASLTSQLLAFSRKQILQPVVLDLNAIIDEASDMLRRIIGEDIELTTDLVCDLGTVIADRSQVDQILMNLAVNARDAMARGGRLTIQTRNQTLDAEKHAEQTMMPPGRYVVFSSEDTGCGIPNEIRRHIFEPFFTTKEASRGTGLGLSTIYGIVEQSGGYIEIETEVKKGTCFTIYLPEAAVPAGLIASDEDEPSLPSLGTGNILVVEDEDAVRITAVEMLETCGYNVVEARDAQEALQLSPARQQALDLLITDVVMPGKSGRELAQEMGRSNPNLAVVYMTGYADEDVLGDAIREDGMILLKKPFSITTLVDRARQALGRGRQASRCCSRAAGTASSESP